MENAENGINRQMISMPNIIGLKRALLGFFFSLLCLNGVAWAVVNCGASGSVNTLGTCAGVTAGTREYDASYSTYKVCNGTNWVSMTGSTIVSSCLTSQSGVMEYDSTLTNYKFCNGTSYVSLASNGTTASCAGTTTGTMEYDTTNNVFTWCNGTNWVRIEGKTGASKCIFATSTTYNGALGGSPFGTTKGDSNCTAQATAGGLTGTYKAWLSDGSNSALSRLTHSTYPYTLVDGTVVANDWNDLVDGTPALAAMGKIQPYGNFPQGGYVTVYGNYAYATDYTALSLTSIDVSNPAAPTIIGSVVDTTNLAGADDLVATGSYVYVIGDTCACLSVWDVTNPRAMKYVTKITTLAGETLVKSGNYLYAAGGAYFQIIDISSPASPSVVGTYTDGGATLSGAAYFAISGNYAYVASAVTDRLVVLNISTPSSPTLAGSLLDATNLNTPGAVVVSGNYAYVTAVNGNNLAVINISTPSTPTFVTSFTDYVSQPSTISQSGNYLFIANRDNASFIVVDITAPTAPVFVMRLLDNDRFTNPNSKIFGNYLYSMNGNTPYSANVSLVDISQTAPAPVEIGVLTDATNLDGTNDLAVSGNYAYITNPNDDSMVVVNISNPASPTYVSSVSDATRLNDSTDIAVSGNYAYVASDAGASLTVINISNPAAPSIVGYVTDSTKLAYAYGVAISGNYAYVVGHTTFAVVDISTPSAPLIVAYITDATHLPWSADVRISGTHAYVLSSGYMNVIDISTPTSPVLTGYVGNPNFFTSYYSNLAISGNYVYALGGGYAISIIDVSTPSTPTIVNTYRQDYANPGSDIKISGNYAFLMTHDLPGIIVLDITSPTTPKLATMLLDNTNFVDVKAGYIANGYLYVLGGGANNIVALSISSKPYLSLSGTTSDYVDTTGDVAASGNYAYVAAGGRDRFTVVDVSNPVAPTVVASLKDSVYLGLIDAIAISGNYAYVTCYNPVNRLTVIDISSPTAPVIVGSYKDDVNLMNSEGIAISGNYAYVSGDNNDGLTGHLTAINISTPSAPTYAGTISGSGLNHAQHVAISGNYAYVTTWTANKLVRVNITTPSAPTIANTLTDATNIKSNYGIVISGNYAYLTSLANARLTVVDISNTASAPTVTGTVADTTYLYRAFVVAISGNYVYVGSGGAASTDPVTVVNVTTPASPTVVGSLLPAPSNNPPTIPHEVSGMAIANGYLYLAGSMGGNDAEMNSRGQFHIAQITSTHTPINRDETGASIASGSVWTGTVWDGSLLTPNCTASGTAWRATNTTKAVVGDLTQYNRKWTSTGTTINCSTTGVRLYCLQQ